ncbi:hypothetical protein ACIQNG_18460 [Streptomyces sp. NPDC091377]|uniref:hypothetical protein n=1 Tax=unclassified Streptomyces TaxID=2593676 RepID=UPI003811CF8B
MEALPPGAEERKVYAGHAAMEVERLAAGDGYGNGLRGVRLYDARASCFTYLADNGVPDRLLTRWAGHTNVKTTKKRYVKPDVADLLPAAEGMGRSRGGCVTDRDR